MRFFNLIASEIRSLIQKPILVICPIAAMEQHGPHLGVATDTVCVTAVAEAVEREMPEQVLLLPTLWLGASDHHLRFSGTLSVPADLYAQLLSAMLEPLIIDGFRKVLVLNGHGGNIDPMHVALRQLQRKHPQSQLSSACYWDLAEAEIAQYVEGKRTIVGHACEIETSMIMHLAPKLVRTTQIVDDPEPEEPLLRGLFLADDMKQKTKGGAVGWPSLANAMKGHQFLNAAKIRCLEVVSALLKRTIPQ